MCRYLLLLALIISPAARADGEPSVVGGRIAGEKVAVLGLTKDQKAQIRYYRRCRNNKYSPYILVLTPEQQAELNSQVGVATSRFAIFESFRGEEVADAEYNIANRFSEDQIEIPLRVVISEEELRNWEFEVMGWQPSPLTNPKRYRKWYARCVN